MAKGNQIASINACAAYFAQANYQVDVTFYPNDAGCMCSVFFDDLKKKESIIKSMRCFKDEVDEIRFSEHKLGMREKFYVLKLEKV